MKTTVHAWDFKQAFKQADRYDKYGYEALGLLFDYLEEVEAGIGEEFELDVIALCCDWDIDTEEEIRRRYDIPEDEDLVQYLCGQTEYAGMTEDQKHLFISF
jgi:hypothetical protein